MAETALLRISWLGEALRDFREFPLSARQKAARALTLMAAGDRPDIARPVVEAEASAWELRIKDRRAAFRLICALPPGDDLWVLHAFCKEAADEPAVPEDEAGAVAESPGEFPKDECPQDEIWRDAAP